MTFEERLKRYKKEEDFFLVDIYKGGNDPWDTIHDLTWSEARTMFNRQKKSHNVSAVTILVEDWDAPEDDDMLFKTVEHLEKEVYRYNLDLRTFEMTPNGWKLEGEKIKGLEGKVTKW